jgi:hypothetical protein
VTGTSFRMRLSLILFMGISLTGCTQQNAPPPPAPEVVLQAIPAADSARVERIHDMKTWRNPYLIVRPDGVVLLDVADSAEIRLKPAELLPALAALPASNWPYGRVVAAAENSAKSSDQDSVAIRRNKGIVGGILQGAHVAIKWVPSS